MTVPWLQPEQYEAVLGALALLVILGSWSGRWPSSSNGVFRDWLKEKRLRVLIALIASYM